MNQNEQHDLDDNLLPPYAEEPSSATMTEKAPVKDFLTLLLIIPVLPFYIIYLIVRGKNKKFITSFFGILACSLGIIYIAYNHLDLLKGKETKVIRNLDDYLGETEINNKEIEAELKKQVSTLANSIELSKLPPQLKPMLYVKQDMLTINYYHYLISAGYMGENAQGAIYILQNALYSKNLELAKAAYESLALINTEESLKIISVYNAQKEATPASEPAKTESKTTNTSEEESLKTKYNKMKYKLENVR